MLKSLITCGDWLAFLATSVRMKRTINSLMYGMLHQTTNWWHLSKWTPLFCKRAIGHAISYPRRGQAAIISLSNYIRGPVRSLNA